MQTKPTWRQELWTTLALAFPIMAGQLGQMLIGLADTVMVGQLGTIPLAACSLASTILSVLMLFGIGLLTCVSIQVSHAHGANAPEDSAQALRHGLFLAVILGLVMTGLVFAGWPLLHHLGQDPEVVAQSRSFFFIVGISLVFVLLGVALKNYTEALSSPWPAFWITLGGVLLNVALNYLLIYGKLGFPAMGLTGAGVATLISRIAIFAALWIYVAGQEKFRPTFPTKWLAKLHPPVLREQFHLGLPVALQLVLEVGAFSAASLLMGWFGAPALAAHQIALTCAATTFMVPLGLAMATTVRVGQVMGSRQTHRVRRIGFSSCGMVLVIMGSSALLFLLAAKSIAHAFLPDPTVIDLTAKLLIVAGIFQIFDGLQVVGMGALRGLKDVRIPALIAFTAYWVLALPLGWVLAFPVGLGPRGIWWGLAAGLALAALGLIHRFWQQTRPGKLPTDSLPTADPAGNLSSPIHRGRGEMADAQA